MSLKNDFYKQKGAKRYFLRDPQALSAVAGTNLYMSFPKDLSFLCPASSHCGQ